MHIACTLDLSLATTSTLSVASQQHGTMKPNMLLHKHLLQRCFVSLLSCLPAWAGDSRLMVDNHHLVHLRSREQFHGN